MSAATSGSGLPPCRARLNATNASTDFWRRRSGKPEPDVIISRRRASIAIKRMTRSGANERSERAANDCQSAVVIPTTAPQPSDLNSLRPMICTMSTPIASTSLSGRRNTPDALRLVTRPSAAISPPDVAVPSCKPALGPRRPSATRAFVGQAGSLRRSFPHIASSRRWAWSRWAVTLGMISVASPASPGVSA